MTHRYPFAPLAAAMGLSENQSVMRLGINGKAGQQYRRQGMSEVVADRMAVKAGLHPFEVWPDMVDANMLASSICCPECDEPFIPLRTSHRFCTSRCYQRRYKREKFRRLYATDPVFREAVRVKAQARRATQPRAVAVQKRAWYLRNRDRILAAKRERMRSAA